MEFILFILLIIFFVLYIKTNKKLKLFTLLHQQESDKTDILTNEINDFLNEEEKQIKILEDISIEKDKLSKEVNSLSKFRDVRDADIEASKLREQGLEYLENKKQEAKNVKANILIEIKEIKQDALEYSKNKKEKADKDISHSHLIAKELINKAELRAQDIAGEALEAKRNADQYADTAKAMKNIIKGYGNEYIKPTFSLLDELAEEFSHKDAGLELKKAREISKLLIKDNRAAECGYVENYRRTTAITFVIDAFNGKVDSILSRVKSDNFGTLEQQIKDSFRIVQNNGKAFKDATVTVEYLEARLEELKWAVCVQELKLEEREEQKKIKEAIREEEKARREYEKAIKQAEKEEKLLNDALNKARKEVEEASSDEREKFAAKLAELENKLKDVENNNQRAISMAQQTRKGHVYIISNVGSFGEDVYKIGLTRRLEPLDRVKELGDASVPFAFDVHAMILSDDAPTLEKELHNRFNQVRVNKINKRKEFFNLNIETIKDELIKHGVEAKWTMKAEAKEYRESIALCKQNLLQEVSAN